MATARYPIEMINGVPVVTAPEEIDVSNADWLRVILLEAATRRQARFVVDMTGTQFCGSAGVGVLVGAHNRALAERGEMPAGGDSRQLPGTARLGDHRPRPPDPHLP